jgi:D-glycero-beta-D-manno-heptose 1-phosphate adenylyltransferase
MSRKIISSIRQKLYSKDDLALQIQSWKAANERVIFTNGCFDLLHPGHIDYLAKAASLGDKFVIGLNSDDSVQRLKGKTRPIQDENSRAFILSALGFVDAVVFFNEDTPFELISALKPDVLVKGADYKIEQVVGADVVIKNGGSVVLLPYLEGFSTSLIEKKIKNSQS